MSYNNFSKEPEWVRSKRKPEFDKLYGDKLYYFDPGNDYGYKADDGYTWYRLNCSYWFGDWIEENGNEYQWNPYGAAHRAIYIVREDLLAFIKMKWL